MGTQTGVVRIRGTVGNLTFSKTENGDEVRLKSSLSGDKMRTDSRFKRTRENWAEFARAGKAVKLIRKAFTSVTKAIVDSRGYSRLMQHAMKVVKSDSTNGRGQRTFPEGDLNHLINYEFNMRQDMESSFKSIFDLEIDRVAGLASIDIPELVPEENIAELIGATHFKLVGAVSEIDWEEGTYLTSKAETAEIAYNANTLAPQTIDLAFTPDSTKTILVSFGIWFYQEVNGNFYLLQDGGKSAMAIVGIDHP